MASITKHKENTYFFIKHTCRELPPGKNHSNQEIDATRRADNYSIIRRGRNAKEINKYRKAIEKQLYHINRKGLVKSVEVCITLPDDCADSEEKAFFTECTRFITTLVPAGAIFLAEVHKDEGIVSPDGKVIAGKPHIHIMFTPAVKDTKHENFNYKLCGDALTKKRNLREFHPNLQKWITQAGIKATVHSGVTGGKNISVKELKSFTKSTGLTLNSVRELEKNNTLLLNEVQAIDAEKQKLKDAAYRVIAAKEQQISDIQKQNELLQEQVLNLQEAYFNKQQELENISKEKCHEKEQDLTWGHDSVWGTHNENIFEEDRDRSW